MTDQDFMSLSFFWTFLKVVAAQFAFVVYDPDKHLAISYTQESISYTQEAISYTQKDITNNDSHT